MKIDPFSASKRYVEIAGNRIAYYDRGSGPAVLFLHGCPFSSFVWRNVISLLAPHYRCIAPDLLGLGDTETPSGADWSLRAQCSMVVGLLDALNIDNAHVVGHDHGGAVAQLLAAEHPHRVNRLVLSNVEAFDNWPSEEERPFVRLTQIPILGGIVLWIWSWRPVFRALLIEARAVFDRNALTRELLRGYVRANFSTRHRRAKTRRFLALQFDPANNRTTLDLLPALRSFDHPTILIWGENDPHFGPEWAKRLALEILGTVRIELLPRTGHLLMEEKPDEYASAVRRFLEENVTDTRR